MISDKSSWVVSLVAWGIILTVCKVDQAKILTWPQHCIGSASYFVGNLNQPSHQLGVTLEYFVSITSIIGTTQIALFDILNLSIQPIGWHFGNLQ